MTQEPAVKLALTVACQLFPQLPKKPIPALKPNRRISPLASYRQWSGADERFLNWRLKKAIGLLTRAENSGGGKQQGFGSEEEGCPSSVVRCKHPARGCEAKRSQGQARPGVSSLHGPAAGPRRGRPLFSTPGSESARQMKKMGSRFRGNHRWQRTTNKGLSMQRILYWTHSKPSC